MTNSLVLLPDVRIPYGLRRVPRGQIATLLKVPPTPQVGDIALARLESIGKNARLELACGRPCTLHVDDLLAVVFGNRYASQQFEGYAGLSGDCCDLLSMGGLCGLVQSKHSSVAGPSKLRLLGMLGDPGGRPLHLRDFALPYPQSLDKSARVVAVCGSSMDAGKTHTAMSLIIGLRRQGYKVAGIKLTGTASGKDSWSMLDAGACVALDFCDGGLPSTYLCSLKELFALHELLLAQAASHGADWAVVEIADGVLQTETAALLRCASFTSTIDCWAFAGGDALAIDAGVKILRNWGIEPSVISGVASMSPLCVEETELVSGLRCVTAAQLQAGEFGFAKESRTTRPFTARTATLGMVYLWHPDTSSSLGGNVSKEIVPLPNLDRGDAVKRLEGKFVEIRNGGRIKRPGPDIAQMDTPIGDAEPNQNGDFIFEPGRGGGRMDKALVPGPDFRWRYVQAAHFGEVNTYYHLDRIASYISDLLLELGAPPLPRVVAVVNAHSGVVENGRTRNGVKHGTRWLAFQGGHYRLPGHRYDSVESALSPDGEIHLGPGRQLLTEGALARLTKSRYRANASHNAGIIYHEYGHHITRHTADFCVNSRRPIRSQNNRKAAIDEGTSDYWAATMLGTPHIWAWHRCHDGGRIHARSLASTRTIADYDSSKAADAHKNGTIWASALWALRAKLALGEADGVRIADMLVLKALLLVGAIPVESDESLLGRIRRTRTSFSRGVRAILEADRQLLACSHQSLILETFAARGIHPGSSLDMSNIHGNGNGNKIAESDHGAPSLSE